MKELFDAIPEGVASELVLEGEHPLDVTPPDDDDVIRPLAEEELHRLGDAGSLVEPGSSSLAKHLVWTFGPHHTDLPLVLQLRVEIDGERLVTVDPEIGWLHQGLEKALEDRDPRHAFDLVARAHPDCPQFAVVAYALAVERLLGLDARVPPRATWWRTIALELARVVAHLDVLTPVVHAHADRALHATFLDAGRRARALLDLAVPTVDGVGLLSAIGGLARTIPAGASEHIERALPDCLAPLRAAEDRLFLSPSFVDALRGLGVLSREHALAHGVTGPALRATGLDDDVRVATPCLAYDRVPPRPVVEQGGGALARFRVRLAEVHASSALVLRALAAMRAVADEATTPRDAPPHSPGGSDDEPKGEAVDDGALVLPPRIATATLEAPSGELTFLVAGDGGARLRRAHLKSPSFALTSALSVLLVGARLDEVSTILTGLGIALTEVDR